MIKRLKRTRKDFGGGSGKAIFESAMFRVVVWNMQKGIMTTLAVDLFGVWPRDIHFEGKQMFQSDQDCMNQLTCREIMHIIELSKKVAFEDGRRSKQNEIKACLDLD